MEALLFKSNLRAAPYNKDECRKIKRNENVLRCKQARGTSIQDKRKIPNNLEFSNDSIYVEKENIKPKKTVTKGSSRLELLREWRHQKENQKKVLEKSKKLPFVVKNIVYKGNETSAKLLKEKNSLRNTKVVPKVLKERNTNTMNATHTVQKLCTYTVNKPVQKQSYAEWKKTQGPSALKKTIPKDKLRSCNADEKNGTMKDPQEKNSDRKTNRPMTTRSMKNKQSEDKKNNFKKPLKEKRINKQKQTEKTIVDTQKALNVDFDIENKENVKETEGMNEEVVAIVDPIIENMEPVVNNTEQVLESTESDIENIFSINKPIHDTDEEIITTDEVVVEPFVSENVSFEPPSGLALTNYKFNNKIALDVMSDFIRPKTVPKILDTVNDNILKEMKNPKTPVQAFKERERIIKKTPTSTQKRLSMSSKRTSLTPNPKNFLHKIEDPIAQKIETPKSNKPVLQPSVIPTNVSECVAHFTQLVTAEETKFKISCEKWEKVLEDNGAPEEHQGNVLAAVGQAQLFMCKRFKQFKDLIELHKDQAAEKAAHASDLDGFWEMIYYQVEDVHKRFTDLNKLQENDWIEEIVKKPVTKVVNKPKTKKIESKKPVASSKSKITSKRADLKKFKQQMMAKKQAEEEQQTTSDFGGFVKILTPLKNNEGERVMTPVRRSIRNLPESSKESSNMCLIFPIVNKTKEDNKEGEKDADLNCVVDSIVALQTKEEEDIVNPLRRSTRKTPSKYRSMNYVQEEKKPEDVVCKLFDTSNTSTEEEDALQNEDGESDFSRYLSKTINEDKQVKRDLLTSFDTPSPKETQKIERTETNDLIVFASPIAIGPPSVQQNSSATMPTTLVDDFLL